MVGHYETVIDALCQQQTDKNAIPAKIVASTATIARADSQVMGLYGRDAFVFPPQALRVGDSFFAEERADREGRRYVGVFASGLNSHATAQVRTMAALLQAPMLSSAKRSQFHRSVLDDDGVFQQSARTGSGGDVHPS